tara:strand:- start:719 stop:1039 length:321 start_codon:yes stop_codon:yes gene_type:complete
MELYIIEKQKFASFQSSFDTMLNNLNKREKLDKATELTLLEINNMIDNITYKLVSFNEECIIQDKTDETIEGEIQNIENDNKVIRDLIPLALMYKMILENGLTEKK